MRRNKTEKEQRNESAPNISTINQENSGEQDFDDVHDVINPGNEVCTLCWE